MGIITHEAVIVTGYDYRAIIAFRDAMPEEYQRLLVGPVELSNGFVSFAFLPDGSKEGWDTSNEVSDIREAFIQLLTTLKADWAHVILRNEGEADSVPEDRPYIAASSSETRYETGVNLYELKSYEVYDAAFAQRMGLFKTEGSALLFVAQEARKREIESLYEWQLRRVWEGDLMTMRAGEQFIKYALWWAEMVRAQQRRGPTEIRIVPRGEQPE